eukprot:jgi/Chrzof1/10667/Cz05g07170.t1_LPA1A[v5.2]
MNALGCQCGSQQLHLKPSPLFRRSLAFKAGVAPGLIRRSRRELTVLAAKTAEEIKRLAEDRVRLRSEAEAPFRAVRLVLYGFSIVSAGLATLISIPQLIGALGGARNALATLDVLQNLGINIGAVTIFGLLFRSDWQARGKQVARLAREEELASLKVQLANGKRLPLSQLQGSARVVVIAGTTEQVLSSLEAAAPYKEQLVQRGVFVIPLPIYESGDSSSSNNSSPEANASSSSSSLNTVLPDVTPEDLRWRATPLNPENWRSWFTDQLALAPNAVKERGLYVGLRLDGRVRASGMGCPPWARFAAELAPVEGEGKWTGFFDGFDGRV